MDRLVLLMVLAAVISGCVATPVREATVRLQVPSYFGAADGGDLNELCHLTQLATGDVKAPDYSPGYMTKTTEKAVDRCFYDNLPAVNSARDRCRKELGMLPSDSSAALAACTRQKFNNSARPIELKEHRAHIKMLQDIVALRDPKKRLELKELLEIASRHAGRQDEHIVQAAISERITPVCAGIVGQQNRVIADSRRLAQEYAGVTYVPACATLVSRAKDQVNQVDGKINQVLAAVLNSSQIQSVTVDQVRQAFSTDDTYAKSALKEAHLEAAMAANRLDLARILRGKLGATKPDLSGRYSHMVLRSGSFDDVFELVAEGDVNARKRALQLAGSQAQRDQVRYSEPSMSAVDFDEALTTKDLAYARKLRQVIQTKPGYLPSHEAQFKGLVWSRGTFDDVMSFLSTDPRGTLSRAHEIAKDDFEKKIVEFEIVKALASKLFVMSFVLDGTGRTRSTDTDMIVGRKIGSEITSTLRYSGRLDKTVFNLSHDYRVIGNVTLRIQGKENGEKVCGFLGMSKCEYKDEPYSESVNVPVTLNFTKGNSYQTTGAETIKWDAVSGGSGLASGRYFGGTRIRKADDLSLTFSLNSVEKM